jgi:multidrug efflux pump subunit AcrA (membrane-fusion protein)
VAGTAPGAELVIVFDATSNSTQWQAPDGNAGYSFAGMTAGDKYTVVVVGDEDASCSQALAAASRDQAAVTDATTALKRALTKLDSALATLPPSGSAHSGGTASKGATGARSGASGGSGSGNSRSASGTNVPASGSASGAARTVTAERIAADTQAVDAAKAQLTVARHDVGYATLISPIAGTVGSISLRAGQSVGRSSSTATIVVVGSGALTTEVDIPLAQIDLVRSGQTVQVTVDGRSQPLAGKVTYVGTTNASSSTGSAASYPVTVTLNAVDSTLFDGMGASVAIDVGTARQVLTVPLSAVHTAGSLHTVQRYADGKATLQRVALGVQGGQRVQVTSGLSLGDRVVLADIGAAVPSSTNGQRGGFGGLSGGGFGGGSGGGFGGKPAFVVRPGR